MQYVFCYEVADGLHSLHIGRPTTKNQITTKRDIAILTRPKDREVTLSTNTPSQPQVKSLKQRQDDYALARAKIFNSAPAKSTIYKHPNHASRRLNTKPKSTKDHHKISNATL